MTWTHRRTWKDHRATDRVVCLDGKVIARVYDYEHGPQAGAWGWFGQWTGPVNRRVAPSLGDALEAVRTVYQRRVEQGLYVPAP